MRNKPRFKVSRIAHCPSPASGHSQIFREYKFDAFHQHIPAGRIVVCGNRNCLHSPLMLGAPCIYFCQNDSQRQPFPRAYFFYGHIQLKNTSTQFQICIPYIDNHRILTTAMVISTGTGHGSGLTITPQFTVTNSSRKIASFPSSSE